MAGKSVTHTEDWWATLKPDHITRCTAKYKSNGQQCRREAHPGTNVCMAHGATLPSVQAAAARRIGMSVDDAAKALRKLAFDESGDPRVRLNAIQDLLDRGGLGATSKVLVGVVQQDPVERLFADILGDPTMLEPPGELDPELARELAQYNESADELDVIDAEVVEDGPSSRSPSPRRARRAERPRALPAPAYEAVNGSDTPPPHILRELERLL